MSKTHPWLFGIDENKYEISYIEFKTQVIFSNFCKARDLNIHKEVEKYYIIKTDTPFHRYPFLLSDNKQNSDIHKLLNELVVSPTSLSILAIPIAEETINFLETNFLKMLNT